MSGYECCESESCWCGFYFLVSVKRIFNFCLRVYQVIHLKLIVGIEHVFKNDKKYSVVKKRSSRHLKIGDSNVVTCVKIDAFT